MSTSAAARSRTFLLPLCMMCKLAFGMEGKNVLGKALHTMQQLAVNAVDSMPSSRVQSHSRQSQSFLAGAIKTAASAEVQNPSADTIVANATGVAKQLILQPDPGIAVQTPNRAVARVDYGSIQCYTWNCECPLQDWKRTWAVSLLDDPASHVYVPEGSNLWLVRPEKQDDITLWRKVPYKDAAHLSRWNVSLDTLKPRQIWESPQKTHYYLSDARPLNFRISCYMDFPEEDIPFRRGLLGVLPLLKDLCNRRASKNLPSMPWVQAWASDPTKEQVREGKETMSKNGDVCLDVHGDLLNRPMPNTDCQASCNELQYEGSSTQLPM